MRWAFFLVSFALCGLEDEARARAPLSDPVALNIGISCQWQQKCMKAQSKAMKRSLKYVNQSNPPLWRLQMCNRNAGRDSHRVDWVGFDNCIRNTVLRPLPARLIKPVRATRSPAHATKAHMVRKPAPRLTESAPVSPPSGPGERG